jgi:drug/metabolite transporter (DMT)-like permease
VLVATRRRRARPTTRSRALVAVILAVIGWSASSLFVRAAHSDAAVFTTWRLWFALPPLAAIVALRRRRNPSLRMKPLDVTWRRWSLLLAGGGALFAGAAATAFAAIGLTRLLDVTLITALQPVVIAGFAVMALGERVSAKQWTVATTAILGTAIVATAGSGSGTWSLAGDVVAVVSLFVNAGWFLYGRVLRSRFTIDPFSLLLGVFTAAALLLTPVAWISAGGLHLSAAAVGYAACTMATGTTAHALMIWAHRYVPASISAPLMLAEPPIVALGAWWCFGEALGAQEIIGSAVVLAALFAMVRTPTIEHSEASATDPIAPV